MSENRIIGDQYEIGEIIGMGGMGAVYRGMDRQTGKLVAIKSLRAEIVALDPNMVERFAREGEALRRLQHPNIVTMLEAIEDNNEHFLIMEYVAGGSLHALLAREKKLPVKRVLEIALGLADALTCAHHLRIIHRDLKPGNVLLAEDGTPRLTDFGVAHMHDSPHLTHTGAVVGTWAYLSPEALQSKTLDARTDIWAFGVILFEMLAGQHPFQRDSVSSIVTTILMERPPDLRALCPDMPEALNNLILWMLVKNREKRISSVRQVAAYLEAILSGSDKALRETPVLARAPDMSATPPERTHAAGHDAATITPAYPMTPVLRQALAEARMLGNETTSILPTPAVRVKKALPLVVVVVILLGILGGLAIFLNRPQTVVVDCVIEPGNYMILVADLERIGGVPERDVSRFIVDDLIQTLEVGVPFSTTRICHYPAVVTSAAQAGRVAETNRATVIVWGNYNADFVELAIQVGVLDGFPHNHMTREKIEAAANVRVHLKDERAESAAPEVLASWVTLHNADGNGYEAMRALAIMQAISVTPATIVGDSPASHGVNYFLHYISDPSKALDEITKSIDLYRNPIQYMSRSGINLRLGNVEAARQDAQTALRLGPEGWALPYYVFANIALVDGDMDDAIEQYKQIVILRPDDWFPINMRGAIYYLNGDIEKAKADITRAIELGPNANFPYVLEFMIALREARIADAQATIDTVLQDFPDPAFGNRLANATFGDKFPIIFAPIFSAFGNMTLGEYQEILRNVDSALKINAKIPDLYLLQGFAYCNLRDYDAAEAAYTEAIALDADLTVSYILRAEARLKQNELLGAAADVAAVMQSDQAEPWTPIIRASQAGKVSCENLLEVDLASLADN